MPNDFYWFRSFLCSFGFMCFLFNHLFIKRHSLFCLLLLSTSKLKHKKHHIHHQNFSSIHLHTPFSPKIFIISFRYLSSVSSNYEYFSESISNTPITFLSQNNGITISDFENELQAIWPSNFSTSSTMIVCYLFQDEPQTPLPFFIYVHAMGPWNGPKSKKSSFRDSETK